MELFVWYLTYMNCLKGWIPKKFEIKLEKVTVKLQSWRSWKSCFCASFCFLCSLIWQLESKNNRVWTNCSKITLVLIHIWVPAQNFSQLAATSQRINPTHFFIEVILETRDFSFPPCTGYVAPCMVVAQSIKFGKSTIYVMFEIKKYATKVGITR